MTNNCDFYKVHCDQCTSESFCRDYLPGVAGFCYRYSDSIASVVQATLPSASGIYGLSLLAKRVLPTRETTEAWLSYAKRAVSSVRSTIGDALNKVQESVSLRPDESLTQTIQRTASHAYEFVKEHPKKIAGAAASLGASLVVTHFLPAVAQMPAITALALGTLAILKNGSEWKAALNDLVTIRPNESRVDFEKRKRINACKALVCTVLLATIGTVAGILIPQIIQKSTTYNVWLPYQTAAVAFMEYDPLVIAHALIALKDSMNGKKASALFHVLSSLSTLAFPLYIVGTHQPLRLHHFWIGQFFQTLPALSAKLFGLFLSVDGWVQITTPTGYDNYNGYNRWDYSSFGCDNVTMDHLDGILFAGSLALLFDGVSKILISKKTEDLSLWQSFKLLGRKICCCCKRQTNESTPLLGFDPSNYTDTESSNYSDPSDSNNGDLESPNYIESDSP